MNSLPIDAALPALLQTLRDRNDVVLQAPPAAGKATYVPWRYWARIGWLARR